MNAELIITIIVAVLCITKILNWMRKGKKRIWQFSLINLVTILISASAAIPVSGLAAKFAAKFAYKIITQNFAESEISEIITSLPDSTAALQALMGIIIAPLLFYMIFSFIRAILKPFRSLILDSILKKSANKEQKEKEPENNGTEEKENSGEDYSAILGILDSDDSSDENKNKKEVKKEPPQKLSKKDKYRASGKNPIGLLLGTVCGFLIVIISWAPILGFASIFGTITDTISAESNEELEGTFDTVNSLANNSAFKVLNVAGGKFVFDAVSSTKFEGNKITLSKEVESISCIYSEIEIAGYKEAAKSERTAALERISYSISESTIIPIILADFLSGASESWERGEEFIGIAPPISDDGSMIGAMLDNVYSVFKSSSVETAKDDAATIINILIIAIENDITLESDSEEENPILSNTEFLRSVLLEMLENEHFAGVVKNGMNIGLSLISETLGTPESLDGLYNNLLSEIVSINYCESTDALAEEIKQTFGNFGIQICDDYLFQFASYLEGRYGLNLSGANEDDLQTLMGSLALKIVGKDGIEHTVYINSQSVFESYTLLKTADTIKAGEIDIENAEREVDMIVNAIASIGEFSSIMSADTSDIAPLMKNIGVMLDSFSTSALIGKECTEDLVIALFQSPIITDALSSNRAKATGIANTIIAGAQSKNYETVMNDLAKTVNAIGSISSSEKVNTETIKDVLTTITPESSEVIQQMMNSELISDMGVKEESVQAMSDIVTNTLSKLASSQKDGNISEEEYNAEIDAIAYLIDTTINMSSSPDATELTISDYVNTIVDSNIATSAIVEAVYGASEEAALNPLDIEYELSENEKTELADALNDALSDADEDKKEETIKTLTAIASIINIEIIIEDGNISLVD